MKNTTYRFPITMADDCRLADLFRDAERKRDHNRINWAAVAAITLLVIVDGACLVSIIWAWRHFR